MSKKSNLGKLSAIWQYPIETTYKGLQLDIVDTELSYVFKTKNPIVDFINYKQFLLERSSTLMLSSVLFNQSFVDFLTLPEGKYRIAYFDGLERVSDQALNSLTSQEAMGMFEYYIADEYITDLDGLTKTYHRVMKKLNKTH